MSKNRTTTIASGTTVLRGTTRSEDFSTQSATTRFCNTNFTKTKTDYKNQDEDCTSKIIKSKLKNKVRSRKPYKSSQVFLHPAIMEPQEITEELITLEEVQDLIFAREIENNIIIKIPGTPPKISMRHKGQFASGKKRNY